MAFFSLILALWLGGTALAAGEQRIDLTGEDFITLHAMPSQTVPARATFVPVSENYHLTYLGPAPFLVTRNGNHLSIVSEMSDVRIHGPHGLAQALELRGNFANLPGTPRPTLPPFYDQAESLLRQVVQFSLLVVIGHVPGGTRSSRQDCSIM